MIDLSHEQWRVGLVDDTAVTTYDGEEIALIQGDYSDPAMWPVMEARARLIAAAPELLEALESAHQFIQNGIEFGYISMPADKDDPTHRVLPTIRAAIAKAEGKP